MNTQISTLDNKLIDYIFFKLPSVEAKILKIEIEQSKNLQKRYDRILQYCDSSQSSYDELHNKINERLLTIADTVELEENTELEKLKAYILSIKKTLAVFANKNILNQLYHEPLIYIDSFFSLQASGIVYRNNSNHLLKSPNYEENFTASNIPFILKEKHTGLIHLMVKDNHNNIILDEFTNLNDQRELTVIYFNDLYPGVFYWTITNDKQETNTGHFYICKELKDKINKLKDD